MQQKAIDVLLNCLHGRREPNVGPGSAQILGISDFVNSKKEEEKATIFYGFNVNSKAKKRLLGKMPQFSPDFDVISKKKFFDVPQTDLSVSFPWAL